MTDYKKIKKMLDAAERNTNEYKPSTDKKNIVAVLNQPDLGVPFVDVFVHWINSVPHVCPSTKMGDNGKKQTIDKKCPICKHVSKLYDSEDDGDKKTADDLRAKLSSIAEVVDLTAKKKGGLKAIPYRFGKTIRNRLLALFRDPEDETGEATIDYTDLRNGRKVLIEKVQIGKTSRDVQYQVYLGSELKLTKEERIEIKKSRKGLDIFTKALSLEELKNLLTDSMSEEEPESADSDDEDDDADEETSSKKSKKSKKEKSSSKKKSKVEDEDEDDEEVDDEDEDEEVDDEDDIADDDSDDDVGDDDEEDDDTDDDDEDDDEEEVDEDDEEE